MERPADIKEPPKMLDSDEEGDAWKDQELGR
jgi:hypothetical protein